MEDTQIFGNTASSSGGGVYVSGSTFTTNNSEIYFNSASSGGGVYVAGGARIIKIGGTVYGYIMGDSRRNTATAGITGNDRGHAVYVNSSPNKRRENTAGPELNLDSDITGTAGGWE
jgi:predicted outer membrane repeat protein